VDAAAFALGEWCSPSAAAPLAHVASAHDDARCREAAVAALGAIGDLSTLEVVLAALGDKPPVRRRAVVALAGFDDPRVEEALATMSEDRDWQTRAAASRLRD
jgi:HEAT repeat protein